MRRLTQAGVPFFEASLGPWGDTSQRECLSTERETSAMGGARSLNKSESEVHVSIGGNCTYLYLLQPARMRI